MTVSGGDDDSGGQPVFDDQVGRWFGAREVLPPLARPVALRWTWAVVAALLVVLVVVAVAIGVAL